MEMDSEVRDVIREHGINSDEKPDFSSKVNLAVQEKFDFVFGEKNYSDLDDKDATEFEAAVEEGELDAVEEEIVEDIAPISGVSLDFGDDESEENKAIEQNDGGLAPSGEEVPMSTEDDNTTSEDGLEFELGLDDDDGGALEETAPAPEESPEMTTTSTETADGINLDDSLMIQMGQTGDTESLSETDLDADLDLGGGDDLDLGLGDDDDFSLDSTGSTSGGGDDLDLGSDDDLDLGGGEDIAMDSSDGGGLDLGDGVEEVDGGDEISFGANPAEEAPSEASTPKEFDYKSGQNAANDEDDIDLGDDLDDDDDDAATKIVSADEAAAALAADDEFEMDDVEEATTVAPSAAASLGDDEFDVTSDNDADDEFDVTPENDAGIAAPIPQPIVIGGDRQPTASINQDELVRLQATIRHLKEEREGLLEEVDKLREEKREFERKNTGLRADIDEARIEVTILRQRQEKEYEEIRRGFKLEEERRTIAEEKARHYQKEFERLGQKVRIDINKIRKREKELESQLELQSMDSESQVRTRDQKILELKRKIDSLEFNMENFTIKEAKTRDDKYKLEERLGKIMGTLRGSIQLLEEEIEEEEMNNKLKRQGSA